MYTRHHERVDVSLVGSHHNDGGVGASDLMGITRGSEGGVIGWPMGGE